MLPARQLFYRSDKRRQARTLLRRSNQNRPLNRYASIVWNWRYRSKVKEGCAGIVAAWAQPGHVRFHIQASIVWPDLVDWKAPKYLRLYSRNCWSFGYMAGEERHQSAVVLLLDLSCCTRVYRGSAREEHDDKRKPVWLSIDLDLGHGYVLI